MTVMDLPCIWTETRGLDERLGIYSDAVAPAGMRPMHHGLEGNDHLQQPFLYERVFTPEQCARIRVLGASQPVWKGRSSSEEESYRVCHTSWLEETSETTFIYSRLRELVRSVNSLYGLDTVGFAEPLNYICYEPGGHFDWHTDLGVGPMSTRKISISVQLSEASDYEGGDLEFCPHGVIDRFRGVGNAVAFPAYIAHRVLPVTTGRRHALVAWIHGPRLR
jgi:PKHD-type hydroxylase